MAIVMAMYAKSFVLQAAIDRVATIRAVGGGPADFAMAGGVSMAGGAIGGVLWLIVMASAVATLFLPTHPG